MLITARVASQKTSEGLMPDYRGYPVKEQIADVGRFWTESGTTRHRDGGALALQIY